LVEAENGSKFIGAKPAVGFGNDYYLLLGSSQGVVGIPE